MGEPLLVKRSKEEDSETIPTRLSKWANSDCSAFSNLGYMNEY
jgi:hypothetical protein